MKTPRCHYQYNNIIRIDKPTNSYIVISTLKIIHLSLFIKIIRSISEGVNISNINAGIILCDGRYAPRIVGVTCNRLSILINDSNYVSLKILEEVVGNVIVDNTANAVLVVIKRNKSIVIPSFTEDLCTVKSIGMLCAINSLARSDTVCIVGVGVTVKRLELSSLFPCQCMTEVCCGVTLCIVTIFSY